MIAMVDDALKTELSKINSINVLLLAPCHTFPAYSFTHKVWSSDTKFHLVLPDCSPAFVYVYFIRLILTFYLDHYY